MAVDLFANAANTTLTAALTAGATSLTVTSSTPFPAVTTAVGTQFRVIIDSELFIVTNVTGTTWTVTPGAEGTTQAVHANGATVTAIVTAGALGVFSRGLSPLQSITTGGLVYHIYDAGGQVGNGSKVLNTTYAAPFPVNKVCTADRLGVQVSALGAAGAVVRLGIYADDGGGKPGALVVDGGTVDATTAGYKEVTVSAPMTPGMYWTASVMQVAGCSVYDMSGLTSGSKITTNPANLVQYGHLGFVQNGVTGALPSPFVPVTSDGNPGNTVPRVIVRIT